MSMQKLKIELTLLADAFPGTGIGTELINNSVPRDHLGKPIVPASHVKGLLRQSLLDLAAIRGYPPDVFLAEVLGKPGTSTDDVGCDGTESIVFIETLHISKCTPTRLVTRTAINSDGIIDKGSLRTNESLAVGSKFEGYIYVRARPDSWPDLALRVALLSLDAIGGNRNRGAGACLTRIEGETRGPGQLLKALDAKKGDIGHQPQPATESKQPTLSSRTTWLEISFVASSPICCPETPTTSGNNVIKSGFVIPASAVQGAVLTMINRNDSGLATACFESDQFRCWPLQPAGMTPDEAKHVVPVRVASSHRMSKLADVESGNHVFRDSIVEPYDWRSVAKGSPLKGSDGVLLRGTDSTRFWRHGDMPRIWTAHGVHNGAATSEERNLYQIESLAPMVFKGLMACPQDISERFIEILNESFVSLGRSRSVRGGGTLRVKPIESLDRYFNWTTDPHLNNRIFVLQSPVGVPDSVSPFGCAEAQLKSIVELPIEEQIKANGFTCPGVLASANVLFGWNRHGRGARANQRHNRLRARRVITPGSVFALRDPVDDLESYLLKGIGEGKQEGLGCILPHPGIAESKYARDSASLPVIKSTNQAGRWGLKLHQLAPHVSPSQIGHLAALAEQESTVHAQQYLDRQLTERSIRTWDLWKPVKSELDNLFKQPEEATAALRVWRDLAIENRI